MSDTKNLHWDRVTDAAPNTLVYRLHGVMGETDGAFALHDALREDLSAEGDEFKHVVINMADVEFLSSTGIGIVASCHTTAKNGGRTVALAEVRRQAARVLDITGVGAIVPRFKTEAEAIDPDATPERSSF